MLKNLSPSKYFRFALGPLVCENGGKKGQTATFYLEEGAFDIELDNLPQLDTVWDFYLELKTARPQISATIFEAYSHSDRLSLSVEKGLTVRLQFNNISLEVVLEQEMSDDSWHSLQVEVNVKEIYLNIDKNSTVQREKMAANHYRPLKFSTLFVGATRDFTNGFLGCAR